MNHVNSNSNVVKLNSPTCHVVEYLKWLLKEIRQKWEKKSNVTLSTFEVVVSEIQVVEHSQISDFFRHTSLQGVVI